MPRFVQRMCRFSFQGNSFDRDRSQAELVSILAWFFAPSFSSPRVKISRVLLIFESQGMHAIVIIIITASVRACDA